MEFAAFGDSNLGTEQFLNGLSKGLADIPAVGQNALNGLQISSATTEGKQCPFAVSHLGRRDGDCVGQALGVDGNVALDPRNLLARIVAFLSCAIGILDALRVDDQKARRGFAPLFCTSLANHIFLKPAPGR